MIKRENYTFILKVQSRIPVTVLKELTKPARLLYKHIVCLPGLYDNGCLIF